MYFFVLFPHEAGAQIAPTNSATISGSVSNVAGKPVANAKISLTGPRNASAQTDAQGLFVFVGLPFGTYQIATTAENLGTAMRTISVQGDTNVAIQYEPASTNGLKTIAHVSSTSSATFNVTSASLTQVSPVQNAFEGKTSWRTILEQIPGVAQAGLGHGQYATSAIPDSPLSPMQISINGALPYETAVLLDDMPLIGTPSLIATFTAGSGTNLGLYPLNGFGSADVVRGPGANSPSIVDSIGGSFVLHAPGAVSSNHYVLSLSTDPYGGVVANAQAAIHWKKLSAVVTYGVNDSPGPLATTSYPALLNFTPLTVNGEFFSCTDPNAFGNCATQTVDPRYRFTPLGFQVSLFACCTDQSAAWSQHSGSVALNYALSPSVNAELFYAGAASVAPVAYNYYTDTFTPPTGYTGSIPAGQSLVNYAGFYLTPFQARYASSLLEEKIVAQVGRGTLRLAALQNNVFIGDTDYSPSSANLQLFGGGVLCTTLPCNSSNPSYMPTVFNGGTYSVDFGSCVAAFWDSLTSKNRDLSLNFVDPLGEKLHAGISFVRSYYDTPSQDYSDYAGCISLTDLPSAVSETSNELRLFVGGSPSMKTSLDLSAYFVNADYHVQNPSDATGNTYLDERYTYAAPRLGFVWRPTAAIAIRAAAGGGFAEAPLSYINGNNGTPSVNSPSSPTYYSVSLENVNLQPETSFAFDVGTDIRLHHNTVLSFDIYRSNLYGQFYNSTAPAGTYTGAYGPLPLYTTTYRNLGVSRYEGVLLDLRRAVPHGLYWSLSGGLTRGYVVSVPAGFYNAPGKVCNFSTDVGCKNENIVPTINFNGEFSVSIPYAQGLGTIGYRWNPDKYVDLVGTYYGNNNTYFRPAFAEFDGHIGYPLSKTVSLLVTFRNITGVYDGSTSVYTPSDFTGAPSISGAPYGLDGEMYGPRTVLVNTTIHL